MLEECRFSISWKQLAALCWVCRNSITRQSLVAKTDSSVQQSVSQSCLLVVVAELQGEQLPIKGVDKPGAPRGKFTLTV
jgi:hypothetical protein